MTRINELFEATLVVGLAAFFAIALVSETRPKVETNPTVAQLAQVDGARHG